ncbi:MAG: glycosyltransferase family 4 protein [Pseudobdellovibrionaceae bacterium]
MSPHKSVTLELSSLMGTKLTGVGRYILELMRGLTDHQVHVKGAYKIQRLRNLKQLKANLQGLPIQLSPHAEGLGLRGLLHCPDVYVPFLKPQGTIVTVHDLQTLYPGFSSQGFSERGRKSLESLFQSDLSAVIVPSHFVKKEIEDHFPNFKRPVFVIPHGFHRLVSPPITQKRSRPYFLYLGTLEERKNTLRLIHAFEAFCETNKDVDLVLVGSSGFGSAKIDDAIQSSKWLHRIERKNFLSDQEVVGLIKSCVGFVYPSLYEGFGLPIIEAMSLGAPVITSNRGAMAEVSGGQCLLIHPESTESLAAALTELSRNSSLRESLSQKSLVWAQNFSWEKSVNSHLDVYRRFI